MKKFFLSAILLATCAFTSMAQTPKFVFYFIGDGMGLNQVNGTETYLAAQEGRIGIQPLTFADFPYTTFATSYSASNGITDSAAGGTALATGHKTYNGCIGLMADSVTAVTSVAVWAREAGAAVGVSTSVSIDHATPAAFYAHQPSRSMYYEIGQELAKSQFDFFGGSDFLHPERQGQPSLYEQAQQAGYTIARGYKDYGKKAKKADKMILFQTEEASRKDRSALPYAKDRQKGDMSLQEIVRAGINFLTKKNPERFFLMVEGGKIDWACHSNDAATVYEEVIDMDNAIRVAYEFYAQHPDETLIVVTADHETGGLGLGNGDYVQKSHLYKYQRQSVDAYSRHISQLIEQKGEHLTYDIIKADLRDNFGFWASVPLHKYQEDQLKRTYDDIIAGRAQAKESMYSKVSALAETAKAILNRNAHQAWTSGTHTNGYVPVFAIGAGAEQFHGRLNNIDIPVIIGRVAGYK